MDHDVDGHPPHRAEGGQEPHRVFGGVAEDVLALADHNEGLKKRGSTFAVQFIR